MNTKEFWDMDARVAGSTSVSHAKWLITEAERAMCSIRQMEILRATLRKRHGTMSLPFTPPPMPDNVIPFVPPERPPLKLTPQYHHAYDDDGGYGDIWATEHVTCRRGGYQSFFRSAERELTFDGMKPIDKAIPLPSYLRPLQVAPHRKWLRRFVSAVDVAGDVTFSVPMLMTKVRVFEFESSGQVALP